MANTSLDDLPIYNMAEEVESEDEELEQRIVHMADEEEKEAAGDLGFWDKVGDVFTQGGRGALKLFTWPADVLKVAMIGEGLSDLDDLEREFQRADKPFNREAYVRAVFDQAQYIPTQELAEQGFEKVTGISLEPKSEWGKGAKQLAEIASFARGGAVKKLAAAGTGVATTQGLKSSGVGEGAAEFIGDAASLTPSVLTKLPRTLGKVAEQTEKQARKYGLPLLQYMTKEKLPWIKGRISANAEKQLMDQFKLSSEQALDKVVSGEIPVKKYQDRGVNLDALAERAYARAERKAAKASKPLSTSQTVQNIDTEIARIKELAPSPTDAQKAAIHLLEQERDILKVSNPTPTQLINQHKNYNADMKSIYAKPEFNGKEEQVRKTYEFLKGELVQMMEKQGAPDVSNAFKGANKIYREKSKLDQTEAILEKAFDGEKYNPKKLQKVLHSKEGSYLKRNIGNKAVQEIEEVAKYGREAQEKINGFIDLRHPSVANEIKQWGQLGWAVFMPRNLAGNLMSLIPFVGKRIQGALLTRSATRDAYKLTLKHAAEGSFELLKKDFAKLEKEVVKEWGTVDDFMDAMMDDLKVYEPE